MFEKTCSEVSQVSMEKSALVCKQHFSHQLRVARSPRLASRPRHLCLLEQSCKRRALSTASCREDCDHFLVPCAPGRRLKPLVCCWANTHSSHRWGDGRGRGRRRKGAGRRWGQTFSLASQLRSGQAFFSHRQIKATPWKCLCVGCVCVSVCEAEGGERDREKQREKNCYHPICLFPFQDLFSWFALICSHLPFSLWKQLPNQKPRGSQVSFNNGCIIITGYRTGNMVAFWFSSQWPLWYA